MLEQHLTEFQVQEYADGKLSSAEMKELKRHLVLCQKCQRQVEFYSRMYQSLAEGKEYVLPENFAKNIAGQVISTSGYGPWLERVFWSIGIVLGLILSTYWFASEKIYSNFYKALTAIIQPFQTIRFEWLPDKEILLLMVFGGMLIKVLDFIFATLFTPTLRKK
ncbi:zf-HC2 domain-containing protein [bacterium]|nr:zf-HC2 domain-containing protein [bacterium]